MKNFDEKAAEELVANLGSFDYCASIADKLDASGLDCMAYQQLDDAIAFLSYVRDGVCDEMLASMDKAEVLAMAKGFIADVEASL